MEHYRSPAVRSPDLGSAKRDPNTGRHLDEPMRGMGWPKRMPRGRVSTLIRRATGKRSLT